MSAPNINAQLKNLSNSGKLTLTNTNNSGRLTMGKAGGGGTTYTIGEAALGGVIAYITGGGSSGTSGFVATSVDISFAAEWGCQGTIIGTSAAIGTGAYNTAAIVAGCPTMGIAARLCVNLTIGGYTDWYLPSKDELNAMYANRAAIVMSGNEYRSSTEWDSDPANYAWTQDFSDGTQYPGINKSSSAFKYVRAIRSF
jgi:hypothetical protein